MAPTMKTNTLYLTLDMFEELRELSESTRKTQISYFDDSENILTESEHWRIELNRIFKGVKIYFKGDGWKEFMKVYETYYSESIKVREIYIHARVALLDKYRPYINAQNDERDMFYFFNSVQDLPWVR